MDIIERLKDDVLYLDAIDDAILEIKRLRQKLADTKCPTSGTVPYATRTEHKRPAPDILYAFLGGRSKLFKE